MAWANNERLVQRENIIPYYSSPPGRHIVLRGVLGKEDRIIDVWCPWCEAQHRHGWDPGLPPRAIRHLGAHCSSTSSPFTSGLYLIGVSQTRQAPGSTRISPTIQGLKNIPDRLIHGNRLVSNQGSKFGMRESICDCWGIKSGLRLNGKLRF
jgi:hypothetical protein